MDIHVVFAVAAIAVAVARYGTYFYTIYRGATKPHAFTWLLWGVVTGIGTFAQLQLNSGPAVWAMGFVSVTCLCVAALAFFIGDRDYTKSDWVALVLCLCALPVWYVTRNPLAALAIIMVIDVLTYWPTIRKSFYKPQTEPPLSYGMAGARYFLMLFAIPDPSWENLMYPFFLMASDWGFAIYVTIRRYQMGYPLHEYAKVKNPSLIQ